MPLISCPIAETAKHHPETLAITTLGEVVTYGELHKRICEYQSGLKTFGTAPLALYASPSVDSIACLWAMFREGIPAFILHLRQPLSALIPYLTDCGIRHVLHETGGSDTDTFTITALQDIRQPSRPQETWLCMDQISTYLMTSGSSGKPKLAAHTLSQHVYSALGMNDHLVFGPTDQWLLSLPLYHVSGLGIVFRCFFAGATVLLPDAGLALRYAISALQPSHLSLVPYQLKQLDHIDSITKHKIRAIILGGSSCPDSLFKNALQKGFPILNSYGMTEMSATITCNDTPSNSAGKVLPYRELKITESGEIAVRGRSLFGGYLESNGYLALPLTHDGWFLTGDTGRMEHQHLYVEGRRDAMIISGGENIQPEEIEAVLLGIPEIQQVCVVGMPDPEFGERPVAFIAPMLPQADLIKVLEKALPKYKWPVRFWGFPDQSGGKPSRHRLREWVENGMNR